MDLSDFLTEELTSRIADLTVKLQAASAETAAAKIAAQEERREREKLQAQQKEEAEKAAAVEKQLREEAEKRMAEIIALRAVCVDVAALLRLSQLQGHERGELLVLTSAGSRE
jgi:hypothetical protein